MNRDLRGVRRMTDDEARVHHQQVTSLPEETKPAPDVDAEGRRTRLAGAADDLDRLRGRMIGVAVERDADGRIADLVAQHARTVARREQLEGELAEATELDAGHAATADAVEAARAAASSKAGGLSRGTVIAVLAILALVEAALAYPAFKLALPAPAATGVLGALLPLMPLFAAVGFALGNAVAQKLAGAELARAHRGFISDPPPAAPAPPSAPTSA